MAFRLQNWSRWSVSANEPIVELEDGNFNGSARAYIFYAPGVAGVSGDTQANIAGASYFDAVNTDIQSGDFVFAESVRDGTIVPYFFTNTDGVITTTAFANVAPVGTANITNLAVTTAKLANSNVTTAKIAAGAAGVTYANVDPALVQNTGGQLTAAEILGCYAAPVAMIAAQGANTMIIVDSFTCNINYGGVQFDAVAGDLGLQYGNAVHLAGPIASATIASTVFSNAVADTQKGVKGDLPVTTAARNSGIYFSKATNPFTVGNSVVDWFMTYRVVPTSA